MMATNAPVSALVWWIIPGCALIGAIIYVVWVARFQKKYENETSRSVGKFKKFQDSLSAQQGGSAKRDRGQRSKIDPHTQAKS
ncbi:MAG: hypothetical protein ACO27S_04925 [Candidatus Nanopelagicaceae bacterium]|jgi:hypothetical protein